jgi:hypothetical protein
VNHGGIRNWRADGNDALYVEDQHRQWYRATFFASCLGLPYAETIGFVTDAGGALDRFSSIVVRDPGLGATECHIRTLDEVPPPGSEQPALKETKP